MERTFFNEFWKGRERLFEGFLATLEISGLVIVIGLVVGTIFGLLLVYGPRPIRILMRIYVDVLRGIPILVLILFSYYGLALIGLNIRSEEHTSEPPVTNANLVCRLLLEKKK